jgi:tripartite-type tricarboxylate transporter receptor subunit TctC
MTLLRSAIVTFLVLAPAFPAGGQGPAYPQKPVRLIVPWPAGGGTDIVARILAQAMTPGLGQNLLIDNRGGAAGIIGTEAAARAAPDGYTLLMGNTGTNALNAAIYRKLSYDPLKDFAPISLAAQSPYILSVHPSLPVKTVRQLIALAKARPGEINYGSGGTGSAPHLAAELLIHLAGIKVVHVPYKGGAAHTPALIAGEVQFTLVNPLEVMPHIRSGRLRPLGVSSTTRWAAAPEIPTIAEAGVPGYEFTIWWGVLGPAGLPRAVIDRLHAEVVKAVATAEVKEKLGAQGVDVVGGTPDAFARLIQSDVTKWRKIAQDARIALD